jgi:hypothetical protein
MYVSNWYYFFFEAVSSVLALTLKKDLAADDEMTADVRKKKAIFLLMKTIVLFVCLRVILFYSL